MSSSKQPDARIAASKREIDDQKKHSEDMLNLYEQVDRIRQLQEALMLSISHVTRSSEDIKIPPKCCNDLQMLYSSTRKAYERGEDDLRIIGRHNSAAIDKYDDLLRRDQERRDAIMASAMQDAEVVKHRQGIKDVTDQIAADAALAWELSQMS